MANNNNGNGRGFAGMDEERQREIASMGGKAAQEGGNAHRFNSEEAREAGRKGGKASHGNTENDNEFAANDNNFGGLGAEEAGHRGGEARGRGNDE
jgi:uncharacterized protein